MFPPPQKISKPGFFSFAYSKTGVLFGILLAIPLFMLLLQEAKIASLLLSVAGVILVINLVVLSFKQDTVLTRNKLLALVFLTVVSIVFWAIFFQIFFSLNLFVERNIDRNFWGYQVPAVVFISFESLFIVLLSPLLARIWSRLAKAGKNPSIPTKFFLSFICMGVAFLLLALSTHFPNATQLVDAFWIPIGYLLITIAELLLSPIGLSAVTTLSPQRMVGMMMGVWFIALGYGGKLAGVIASFSSIPEGITDKVLESQYYGSAFFKYAILSFVVGVLVLVFIPKLKKLIGPVSVPQN